MRTRTVIQTHATEEQIRNILGPYFLDRNFEFVQYKNEQVWQKGKGWLTTPQVFKVFMENDRLVIESWMPYPLWPGVYLGEIGLKGFFGYAIKVVMRNTLAEIVQIFIAPGTEPEGYMPKSKKR